MPSVSNIRAGRAYYELGVDASKLPAQLDKAAADVGRYTVAIARLQRGMEAAATGGDTKQFYRLKEAASELDYRKQSLSLAVAERRETAAGEAAGRTALSQRLQAFKALRGAAQVEMGGLPGDGGVPGGAGGFLGTGIGRRDIRAGLRLGLGSVAGSVSPQIAGTMAMLSSIGPAGAVVAGGLLALGAVVSAVIDTYKEEKKWRDELASGEAALAKEQQKVMHPGPALSPAQAAIEKAREFYGAKIDEQYPKVADSWEQFSEKAIAPLIPATGAEGKIAELQARRAENLANLATQEKMAGIRYRAAQGAAEEHNAAVDRKRFADNQEKAAKIKSVGGDAASVAANTASYAKAMADLQAEVYREEQGAAEEHNAAVDRKRFADNREQEAALKAVGGDRESVAANQAAAERTRALDAALAAFADAQREAMKTPAERLDEFKRRVGEAVKLGYLTDKEGAAAIDKRVAELGAGRPTMGTFSAHRLQGIFGVRSSAEQKMATDIERTARATEKLAARREPAFT